MRSRNSSERSEVHEEVEGPGDAHITDLHIWLLGPGVHAALLSYVGSTAPSEVRARLADIHELTHVIVESCESGGYRAGPVRRSKRPHAAHRFEVLP